MATSTQGSKRILVTGGGGFIGHHLIKRLKAEGHFVLGVDIKYPEYEQSPADEFVILDLRELFDCVRATWNVDEVYQLAATMGGIGFISTHLSECARDNILINANMLEAARANKVGKYLFSSSACVYSQGKQHSANVTPLKEEDAYPADPEPGYGWEKLFAEQMCQYYAHDFGMDIKIVRFHNVYGPLGTYDGGKEKAPAALCRKIAKLPKERGVIEVWGDGNQTRSFMYVDDCVEGLIRLMESGYREPLNLGTDELVTINQLVEKISNISGKIVHTSHDHGKPQGVRGRNSDNTRLREVLGWEPKITLDQGLIPTYKWIEQQVSR
jgi:nucleoside-diphosphate-sugar epimerase